ncbi:unnamed protein product [Angiostrongylus costaricensis]|uniref:Rho-GAP domain-containing protein n=1 Tax=Angiostrongylus costaricensis TaxID=334426 RepID=A0A0R3PTT9_ANGCS|nr:unnamed protein product [Angiostrongylus costaricensis]
MIDRNISWELNDTKLQDILVMSLENGRDYFVPVVAHYYPRCFGVTLEQLLNRRAETEGNLIDFGNEPEELDDFCPPNIPREIYRLICALQLFGPKRLDLNDVIDNSSFIVVRNALESGIPKDLSYLWKIVISLPPVNAAVLEYLINYLRELITQVPSASGWLFYAFLSPLNYFLVSRISGIVFLLGLHFLRLFMNDFETVAR